MEVPEVAIRCSDQSELEIESQLSSAEYQFLESPADNILVHHLDHHQLPMHNCQASYHLIRSVLQHLVPFTVSNDSL
jgi:negative regulator of sigma E activity